MRWQFEPMSRKAADVISSWHYAPPFDFYDMTMDDEDLAQFLDERGWSPGDLGPREQFYAASLDGELAGFFSFIGSHDACTMGLGLAPELTGRALGEAFVRAGLTFARQRWSVETFRLEVASFNVRALKVYERVGFVRTQTFNRVSAGRSVEFVEMTLGARTAAT